MDKYKVEDLKDLVHLLESDLVEYVYLEFGRPGVGGDSEIEVEYMPHKETKTDFGKTKVSSNERHLSGWASEDEIIEFLNACTDVCELSGFLEPENKTKEFMVRFRPGEQKPINDEIVDRVVQWMN